MPSASLEPAGLHTVTIPTPFPVGPVNVFVVEDDPLTLIDAGPKTDEGWQALNDGLGALGYAVKDIERVILTHHHVDHAGLLARIIEESGAETWAHPAVPSENHRDDTPQEVWDQWFKGEIASFGIGGELLEQMMQLLTSFRTLTEPYHIDHTFLDESTVGPFTMYHVPGHSVTDTLLVNHGAGYTIVGDHILETINPNPLLHRPEKPGLPRPKSLLLYQRSLRRARELSLGRCYPGHGEPFDDHVPVVDIILSKHDRRAEKVMANLAPEGMTPYELAAAMWPDPGIGQVYLILSVTVGHLEILEEAGQVIAEDRDGVLYYRPAA